MVGAEDLPPAHACGHLVRGIAAEVAEIAGAGEIEVAGRGIWHGISLSHPSRWRNDRGGVFARLGLVYSRVSGGDMNWRKAFDFRCDVIRSRVAGIVAGAGADLPELSLCRRHAVHRRVLRIRQARPSADRWQGGDARQALWPVGLALFGRRRHVEDHQGRHHGQARPAAGDGMRADCDNQKKGRNVSFRPFLYRFGNLRRSMHRHQRSHPAWTPEWPLRDTSCRCRPLR